MTHEDFSRRHAAHRLGDRRFGLTISLPLAAIGVFPLLRRHPVRLWALAASAIFILAALLCPRVLAPLNSVWARVTGAAGEVVVRVSAAILLYLVFAPIQLIFRLTGRDVLRLKADAGTRSYWISRNPPGPAPESMIHQF